MKNQSVEIDCQVDLISFLGKRKKECKSIKSKVYQKYEYIYHSGEKAKEIYVIKKGRIKIENDDDNEKTIIKNVFTHGELFGESSLIRKACRVDFAIAMEETELYVMCLEEFFQQMQHYTNLTAYIINLLGTRLFTVEQKIESLVFKDARTRVVDFLNDLANKRGQRIGYEIIVREFFTHQEIANITATSRQTVTKVLNELKNKNILIFNRKRLLIRDLNLLK